MFLTLTFFLVEVIGGVLSRSLALLADAAHMFTDVAALILAYAAMTLADRAATKKHTFGLYRAEILAAFINAQVLLLISGYILYEGYQRLRQPPEIRTGIMLWVAAAGLIANLISMKLLRGGREGSLNLKAAYLEVLTDMMGSLGVIAAALVMGPTGWFWLDPVLSAVIGLIIVPRTVSILRESGHILLEGTPAGIDLELLRTKLLETPGVAEVHDLHIWALTSGMNSASVHIRSVPGSDRETLREAVQTKFETFAGVDHATVQVEVQTEAECKSRETHA
jgi:cobalt-zinc-cadmium efflux system protein